MKTEKYNGWTNYETWNYNLWLENDYGTYKFWQQEAQRIMRNSVASDYATDRQNALEELSEAIKAQAEQDAADQLKDQSGWLADAVNAYLGEVDWYEIAEHLLSE